KEVLVEPPRAPDLALQRERSLELDPDLRPRLGAPARLQHHAQDVVDAEPGVPGAGVAHFPHLFCIIQKAPGEGGRGRARESRSSRLAGSEESSIERIP